MIHRANPALGYTDQVLKILARQNRQLAQLATDSDTVLAPLAKARRQLADFVVQANTTAVASAARAADISRSIQLFPEFLRQLRPLMVVLGKLADQGTPLMTVARPERRRRSAGSSRTWRRSRGGAARADRARQLGAAVQPALVATCRSPAAGASAQAVPRRARGSFTASLNQTGAISS